MSATKGTEQGQDSGHQDSGYQNFRLDERYGKIGISAVAAAMCHKGEQRKVRKQRRSDFVYDCD